MRRFVLAVLFSVAAFPGDAQPLRTGVVQGWTESEREIFRNAPVGSRLVPFPWFAALEAADGGMFAAAERLAGYGFLPGVANGANPAGLPVGLSRERDRRQGGRDGPWLGLSCAACHTRAVAVAGQSVLVDGAGSLVDADAFLRDLVAALRATEADAARFARFAGRLGAAAADEGALRERLAAVTAQAAERLEPGAGPDAGPGRFDLVGALGRLVGMPGPEVAVRNAPVWGGTGGLAADVEQALATGAVLRDGESSVSVADLRVVAALLRKLEPPQWPAAFPPVDPALAAEGAAVFTQACASCHAARGAGPGPWVAAETVGTDPAAAQARAAFNGTAGPVVARVAAGIVGGTPAAPEAAARPAYRARPLAGTWAQAPYLHDGSVPELEALLTPPVARAAHPYGTALPENAKAALLAFLKTL